MLGDQDIGGYFGEAAAVCHWLCQNNPCGGTNDPFTLAFPVTHSEF
jgi:hypothetical protein